MPFSCERKFHKYEELRLLRRTDQIRAGDQDEVKETLFQESLDDVA